MFTLEPGVGRGRGVEHDATLNCRRSVDKIRIKSGQEGVPRACYSRLRGCDILSSSINIECQVRVQLGFDASHPS